MPDFPSPDNSDPVPLKAKLAWALGSLGDNYASQTIAQLAPPVYNMALGVPAESLASAIAIPRVLDAFADPTVGYLSDNARTRWGRRRPFILAGAIPLSLLVVALWLPSLSWSKSALAIYFAIATFFYYLAYAVYIVPYRALGFELSRDYNERTRVQGWGMILGLVGGLGIPWLYKLALLIGGADPASNQVSPAVVLAGARWVSIGIGTLILITCTAPAFLCRERQDTSQQPRISIGRALLETLKNWPFVNMLLARTFVIVATFAIIPITTPLAVYYLFGGNQSHASTLLGLSGNLLFAGAAIGIPFNTRLSTRIGKRPAFIVCLMVAACGSLSQFITYRPEHPDWILVSQFILGFGIQGVWLMCQSMVADICDADEKRTGLRREGVYGATYALAEKLGINFGFLVGGLLAAWCGYASGSPSIEVLERVRIVLIVTPSLGMVISLSIISAYPRRLSTWPPP